MIAAYRPAGHEGRTYGATLGLLLIVCLVLGAIIGATLRLHERLENLGDVIRRRFGHAHDLRFTDGFLTASVVFCVGPLTLLGCLKNGVEGDPSYLYIKSMLDCFCAMALAAGMGIGVACSIVTVLVVQGGLSVAFYCSADSLPDLSIQMMTVIGGVILFGNRPDAP